MPTSHFFDLAYDFPMMSAPDSTGTWLTQWATREFGASVANETADVMNKYGMYAARRKYELLDPTIYSISNYNEGDTVLNQWKAIADQAQSTYNKLDAAAQPAFYEMVLHPVMAGYVVNNIHISTGKQNLYAHERRTSANTWVQQVLNLFNQDHTLTQRYHSLLNGKWNHMMVRMSLLHRFKPG